MSAYRNGTILARTTPKDDPYDEVKVIGPTPVQSGIQAGSWGGIGGNKLSIQPTSFGTVIDVPESVLQDEYRIVSQPPVQRRTIGQIDVEEPEPQPSPEEVFKAEAKKRGDKPKPRRRQQTTNLTPEEQFGNEDAPSMGGA